MVIDNFVKDTLEQTSRTFYIPIIRLPDELQKVVASAYLSLRAIDEIEDHSRLDKIAKILLLNGISQKIQMLSTETTFDPFSELFRPYKDLLPPVTLSIYYWLSLSTNSFAPRLWDTTATMASRMSYWANNDWKIETKIDLDHYTFGVAGAVGLLLCDIWAWYDGTRTNREYAVGFGRALQAVNILRNQKIDLERGVNFFPNDWESTEMQQYAHANLNLADKYIEALPDGAILDFCRVPYKLALATLNALECGKGKLSREDVHQIVLEIDRN